jgi:copper oxidase (laccase) domain-containing protein
MEDIMMRHPVTGKAHIDLVAANRFWMLRAGVPMENITASGLCTRCQPERFFSARALGVKSGRIVTGIVLR